MVFAGLPSIHSWKTMTSNTVNETRFRHTAVAAFPASPFWFSSFFVFKPETPVFVFLKKISVIGGSDSCDREAFEWTSWTGYQPSSWETKITHSRLFPVPVRTCEKLLPDTPICYVILGFL